MVSLRDGIWGSPTREPPPLFAAGNPGPPVNPHRFSRRGTPGHPSRPLAVPEKICVPLPRLYLFFSTAALSSPCFIRPLREPPTLSSSRRGTPLAAQGSSTPKPPVPLHHRWGGAVIQYTFSCSATAEHRIRRRGGVASECASRRSSKAPKISGGGGGLGADRGSPRDMVARGFTERGATGVPRKRGTSFRGFTGGEPPRAKEKDGRRPSFTAYIPFTL